LIQRYKFYIKFIFNLRVSGLLTSAIMFNSKVEKLKFKSLGSFYCNAANYKTFAAIVFANLENIPLEEIRKAILASCNVNKNFDPLPWSLPNIRSQPYDPELDHNWYEYEMVEETEEMPTDRRSVEAFLEAVKNNPLGD